MMERFEGKKTGSRSGRPSIIPGGDRCREQLKQQFARSQFATSRFSRPNYTTKSSLNVKAKKSHKQQGKTRLRSMFFFLFPSPLKGYAPFYSLIFFLGCCFLTEQTAMLIVEAIAFELFRVTLISTSLPPSFPPSWEPLETTTILGMLLLIPDIHHGSRCFTSVRTAAFNVRRRSATRAVLRFLDSVSAVAADPSISCAQLK